VAELANFHNSGEEHRSAGPAEHYEFGANRHGHKLIIGPQRVAVYARVPGRGKDGVQTANPTTGTTDSPIPIGGFLTDGLCSRRSANAAPRKRSRTYPVLGRLCWFPTVCSALSRDADSAARNGLRANRHQPNDNGPQTGFSIPRR
jgi:hypothetical protein